MDRVLTFAKYTLVLPLPEIIARLPSVKYFIFALNVIFDTLQLYRFSTKRGRTNLHCKIDNRQLHPVVAVATLAVTIL